MTDQITYRNRKTGEMISEPLILPRIQYAVVRSRVAIFIYNILLNTYPFCWLLGKWMDLSGSQKKNPTIRPKIRHQPERNRIAPEPIQKSKRLFLAQTQTRRTPLYRRPPHLLFTCRRKNTRISQTKCTNPFTPSKDPTSILHTSYHQKNPPSPIEMALALVIPIGPGRLPPLPFSRCRHRHSIFENFWTLLPRQPHCPRRKTRLICPQQT